MNLKDISPPVVFFPARMYVKIWYPLNWLVHSTLPPSLSVVLVVFRHCSIPPESTSFQVFKSRRNPVNINHHLLTELFRSFGGMVWSCSPCASAILEPKKSPEAVTRRCRNAMATAVAAPEMEDLRAPQAGESGIPQIIGHFRRENDGKICGNMGKSVGKNIWNGFERDKRVFKCLNIHISHWGSWFGNR